MNLSFAGCGFLGIYHVGVASCFRQYAPSLVTEKITGASAGALAACGLICDCDLGEGTTYALSIAMKTRARILGPFHPTFNVLTFIREGAEKFLPPDAHLKASGKLFISLTRLSNLQNIVISEYRTRQELIEALLCSCFIPFYCGMIPPKYRGVRYVDGGFSGNNPILDHDTITVSPFAGESDICPDDNSATDLHINLAGTSVQFTMGNFYRASHALFPPNPEVLADMCQQGFDDALKFLQKNNLLACTQHLSIMSSISAPSRSSSQMAMDVSSSLEEEGDDEEDLEDMDYDREIIDYSDSSDEEEEHEHCSECRHQRQVALVENMPQPVVSALQTAIDSVNNSMFARLYKMRAYKVFALMAQPWVLPIEITLILGKRFIDWAPYMPSDMQWASAEVLQVLRGLYEFIQHSRHKYSARLTCQLAITELDYQMSQLTTEPHPAIHHHHHHHHHHNPTTSTPVPPDHPSTSSSTSRRNFNLGLSLEYHSHHEHQSPLDCASELRHSLEETGIAVSDMTPIMEEDVEVGGGRHVHVVEGTGCSSSTTSRRNSTAGSVSGGASSTGTGAKESGFVEGQDVSYDTFENCLHIANQMDSILSFYYMEEDNPSVIRVKEIFPLSSLDTAGGGGGSRRPSEDMNMDRVRRKHHSGGNAPSTSSASSSSSRQGTPQLGRKSYWEEGSLPTRSKTLVQEEVRPRSHSIGSRPLGFNPSNT